MPEVPEELSGVSVLTKANVYFEGKVVSHTVKLPDGSKKTLGLIFAGEYHFGTKAAERMQVVGGKCGVVVDGQTAEKEYGPGDVFEVAADSGFKIRVRSGICEYICTFLS